MVPITRAVEGEFLGHNQRTHVHTPQQSTELLSIWKYF